MTRNCRYIIYSFILLLTCLPYHLSATHMVGGEINYRCLGNDQYEIMVTVFRDCDTGVPWFDNPASIGIFDLNDSLLYDMRMTLRNNDTLDLNLNDPCLVAPPNVCIHTTTYLDTITLPFQVGGYQIVYQRCCRNQDIVNIVAPTATGATYSSFISEQALLACNSSAVFNEWPPVYVCAGVPITYDHSATDADGDSVVYELCTPFTGATPTQSMPQPPNNPPYNPVTWLPPYSVDNMLGGPDSLIIDPQTGLLTGTPDIIGVFVVGVCAKEYRNGILISTTRRDFQYVVGICGELVSSAFFAPEIQCDNSLIVNFQNNSTTLGTGFWWSFGDTATNATSSNPNPTYIYPDTGRYTITLIADPGTLCADTSVQDVYLQYESISANFDVTTASCTDSFFLDVTDLTIDSISSIQYWDWDFGNGQTDTVPYPTTVYDSSGTYIINLNVTAFNGCMASFSDTLNLNLPRIFSADSVGICLGDSFIVLNPGGDTSHVYQWSPATALSNDTVASPIASPSVTTVYHVTVTVPNGVDTCVLERTITVVISDSVGVQVPSDTATCQDTIMIVANSYNATLVEWSIDPSFSNVFTTGDTAYLPVTTANRWYVRATNAVGCSAIDTLDVFKRQTPIIVDWTYNVISCDTAFNVQFLDQTIDSSGGAITDWTWTFGDNTSSNLQHPIHQYNQSGNYYVSLTVNTLDGCTGSYGTFISVAVPQITDNDTVGICQGNTFVQLNPNGDANFTYLWSPGLTLNDSTAVSPFAFPVVPTTYTVTITAINGTDTCINIQQVHVNFPPPITVAVPPVTVYCGSSVTLTATSPTGVFFEWSGDPSFSTIIGTGNPFTTTPVTFPYAGYYVRATDAYGCSATAFALVEQNQVPVVVNFSYQSMGCSDTMAVQFTDLTADTVGSPITSWYWTTSDGQSSTLQHPVFVFTQSGFNSVTLVVTRADGCDGQMTANLSLNIASLTNDSTIVLCQGITNVQLNQGGNPDLTYQWSPGSFLSSTSDPDPFAFPPSTPFTYTVTVTGMSLGDTCMAVHDVTIVQAPPIIIETPKDTVTCSGVFNVQATITDMANVQQIDWSFNPFYSPVAISNVTSFFVGMPQPPYNLYMWVRVTDIYGCTHEDTAIVFRRNIPIPVDFTPNINTCDDTLDVTFINTTNVPSGMQIQGYSWNFGNGETAYSTDGFAQYSSSGMHVVTLTATSTNGCSGIHIDTLDYTLPILNSNDSVGLCTADSVQLNIGGDSSLQYQWSPAAGLDDPNGVSPMAGPSSTTTYTVTVTAFNTDDTCVLVRDIVVGTDSFVFEAMGDTVLCFNQTELYVNAPTASNVEWALDRDFNLIIGSGNPLVTNVNDARWFYVRGSDNFGCEGLDSVFVHYRGNDIPINFSMTPVNCGDSLVVAFQDISGDTMITNWNWNFGNGQTSTQQNPNTTFYVDSTYTIDLSIQITGNCTGQTSQQLTAQIPVLEVPNNNLVTCGNDSVSLTIQTAPGLTYVWTPSIGLSDSSTASPVALPPVTTTYHVRVYGYSNFNGMIDTCWLDDSITVTVQPAPTVQIQGDSSLCDSLVNLQAVSPQGTNFDWANTSTFQTILFSGSNLSTAMTSGQQWYYVRIEDSLGCESIDSVIIERHDANVNLNGPFASCDGQPIQLVAQNGNAGDTLSYVWSPSSAILTGQGTDSATTLPTNPMQITVVSQNQYGCIDSAQTTVSIAPPLDLTVPNDTILCQGSLLITATSSQPIAQYSWSLDPNFNTIIGQNASLPTNATSNQIVYYIEIEDSLGCRMMDSVMIEYYPAEIVLDSANILCEGLPVQLIATNLNAQDSLTYQWSPNTDILSGQGTDTIIVAPSISTVYTATATNQYGCVTTVQTLVDVSSGSPIISVTTSQDTLIPGTSAQLIATLQTGYSYVWANDPSLSSTVIYNPLAEPDSTTIYYVTVTDVFGCSTMDSIIIYVGDPICDEPNVFVPNAFTPDADGHNDVIYVEGNAITELYFVIYNRWGEQVFESNVKARGWDGTFKGKACPPDVYGYYMICKCLDGNELRKKGNITLLR